MHHTLDKFTNLIREYREGNQLPVRLNAHTHTQANPCPVELRNVPRSRNGPYIHHPLDSLRSKEIQECIDRPSRMPDDTYGSSTTYA